MTQPSFLAIDSTYLAFKSLSSSVSPGVTISQFTALGSIAEQSLIKNLPSERAESLKFLIWGSCTNSFAHLTKSSSFLEPTIFR